MRGRHSCDVAVIGAGPAGCAAAITLAAHGRGVVLIEREAFPRPRPGESLHPGIQPLMAALGVESALLSAGFLRFPGIWVTWGSEMRFEPFGYDKDGPWLGFQAWRSEFDALLLRRAKQLGVRVLQPCRVLRPMIEQQRVVGLYTDAGSVRASYVVDGSGGGHWLARQLKLAISRRSPQLIVRFGYGDSFGGDTRRLPALTADDSGWIWTAKVRSSTYHSAQLDFQDGCPAAPASFHWRAPVTPPTVSGADVTWRIVDGAAGPGYFLVGDAAAVLDPTSSHGVLRAVMSGMMAADTIERSLAHSGSEARSQAGYQRWLHNWFEADTNTLKRLYETLPNPPAWISGG